MDDYSGRNSWPSCQCNAKEVCADEVKSRRLAVVMWSVLTSRYYPVWLRESCWILYSGVRIVGIEC